MSEDMALPFELDMEGSQEDLLCLSEEMGRLLDPMVNADYCIFSLVL